MFFKDIDPGGERSQDKVREANVLSGPIWSLDLVAEGIESLYERLPSLCALVFLLRL